MSRTAAVVIACVLVAGQAPAQRADDPFLARLIGSWSGEGTVLNRPAKIQMEWAWALERQFIRLTFSNEMGAAPKLQMFEGHAYYRAIGDGRYRGTWFDSSGAVRPIEARLDGDALVAEWGTAATEVGETTYRLKGPTVLEVVDRVRQKDGTWRVFGQSTVMKR
jgi:hypothetical protein